MSAVRSPVTRVEHFLLFTLLGLALGLTIAAFTAVPIVLKARCW